MSYQESQHEHLHQVKRVLVVDDEVLCRDLVADIMGLSGAQIECAENGAEALALASRGDFDLVLMDWHMPVMDGHEAASRLRETYDARELPIVLISGQASDELIEEAIALRVNGFLPKPFTPGELLQCVNRVMAGKMLRKSKGNSGVYDRSLVGS